MIKNVRPFIRTLKTGFVLGILSFSVPLVQAQNCQTILDDFDGNRNLGAYTTPTGGVLTQAFANPSASGLNTSALVAKYVTSTDPFDNIVVQTDKIKNGDLLRFNQIKLSMMVYSLKLGTIEVTLRKKGSNSLTYPAGRHTILKGTIQSSNTWNLVTFVGENGFAPDATLNGDSIGEMEIKFPVSFGGSGETFYFDNIQLSSYSSIDNFDNSRNIPVKSFVGSVFNQAYPNSIDVANSSSTCAAYKKPAGNGNATITYASGTAIEPDKLKNGIDKLGIQFYSISSMMTVKVSLVNTKVVPNTVHSTYEAKTSQFGRWEFLTLDYKSQPNPGTLASDVDAVVLEFEPGVASTTVYRFDEVFVKKANVAAPVITGDIRPCIGAATYAYSIPAVTSATYEWVVPSGSSISAGATTNAVEVLYSSAFSMKNIHARYTAPGGCPSEWSSKLVSASTVSPPQINAGGDVSICEGAGFKLTGSVGGSSYGTWTSTGNGTFTPNKNVPDAVYTPSAQDAAFGLVTLTFKTVGGNCGQAMDAMDATILEKPAFLSITPNTTLCTTATSITLKATANVGSKLNWYGPSAGFTPSTGVVNNGTDIVYTFANYEKTIGNTSNLQVTTDFGYACGSTTATVKVTFSCIVTAMDEPSMPEEVVQAFPNPTLDGHFSLNLKDEPVEVIVTDMMGRQEHFHTKHISTTLTGVLSAKVISPRGTHFFKLSNLK